MAQRALERFEGQRLAQQCARVDHQEAAVGLQQRPTLDHAGVGDQRAELGFVLDAAHQVVVGRIGFDDHRRAPPVLMINHDVDLVVVEERLGRAQQQRCRDIAGRRFAVIGLGLEPVDVVGDMLAHVFEIREYVVPLGVLLFQLIEARTKGCRRDLPVKVLQAADGLVVDGFYLAQRLLHLLDQRRLGSLQRVALLLR